ncbi:hypothetical protein HYS84_03705 [Candidatus Saccharibacteria bacterium]|nr:hypothetical protein [Candidatus Saccharibacteria bacterium]
MVNNTDTWKDTRRSPIDILVAIKKAIRKLKKIRPAQPEAEGVDPSERELNKVTLRSHEIMFKAKTVFPFDLFPDTVVIDREKLTIAEHLFFFVGRTISVPVRDILSVEVDTGPFFGQIKLVSRYFFTNPQSIHFLWRSHAIKLQCLLQGYIIAYERDIDCRNIERDHLEKLLLDLGEGHAS